jgi:capsular polysaccharide biosynthesis protein
MNTDLDVLDILQILKKKILLITVCIFFCGAVAFFISKVILTPMFSANVSMYVYNGEKHSDQSITVSDLNTSQKLVQTYIVVLTSNTVLEKVSDQLNNRYTIDNLRQMISTAVIDNTEAFSITVKNSDPAAAEKIANTIAKIAPNEILQVVKAGAVEVIDYAKQPTHPSSPDVIRNSAVGAVLGFLFAAILAIAAAMMDTTVRCEADLTEHFNLPILGVIPTLVDMEEGGCGRYGHKAEEDEVVDRDEWLPVK